MTYRWTKCCATFLVCLLLGACPAPTGSSKALEEVSVRLNFFAAGYTAPFYVGVDKGWYKEAGLDVTVLEGQGSGLTGQQVAAGQTTFGFVSTDALIGLVAQGAPIKMVASLAQTNGYCVLVKEESGIRMAQHLQGKRFGAGGASAIARMLPAYLKANSVPVDKVQMVSVDPANLYAGFIGGQFEGIEALSFDEPARFEAQGIKTRCLSFADSGVKVLGPSLVANLSTIHNDPDLVRKFVAVSLRAFDYSFKNPQDAAATVNKMAPMSVQDTAVAAAQLKLFEQLKGEPYGVATTDELQRSVAIVKEYLEIKNAPTDMSTLYTGEFLPEFRPNASNSTTL